MRRVFSKFLISFHVKHFEINFGDNAFQMKIEIVEQKPEICLECYQYLILFENYYKTLTYQWLVCHLEKKVICDWVKLWIEKRIKNTLTFMSPCGSFTMTSNRFPQLWRFYFVFVASFISICVLFTISIHVTHVDSVHLHFVADETP